MNVAALPTASNVIAVNLDHGRVSGRLRRRTAFLYMALGTLGTLGTLPTLLGASPPGRRLAGGFGCQAAWCRIGYSTSTE